VKTFILSAVAVLGLGAAGLSPALADHGHPRGGHYHAPYHRPHYRAPHRVYGGYGYVQPYGYPYVAPAPLAPAPVYVQPVYQPYYPQSGVSLYGKNFGFSFSN
jgi:hypothetical protein